MLPQEPTSYRRLVRWPFYLKVLLVWSLLAAMILGCGLVWSVRYGLTSAALMMAAAIAVVLLWRRIAERSIAEKVRRLLREQVFPVNLQSSPPVTRAKPDSWLLLRGTPKGMAIDLTNRLIWLLFDHRKVHALLPSAVSSADIVDGKNLLGRPCRVLRLIGPDASTSFTIVEGDEGSFQSAMGHLLANQVKSEVR